jgi:hypothetical protein
MKPMREPLKSRLLTGIQRSGTYQLPDVVKSIEKRMNSADLKMAERFLNWIVANNVSVGPGTIDVRFHEFKKKLKPVSDVAAVDISAALSVASPPEVLTRLGKDGDRYIRAYVAENHSTPAEVLIRLGKLCVGR